MPKKAIIERKGKKPLDGTWNSNVPVEEDKYLPGLRVGDFKVKASVCTNKSSKAGIKGKDKAITPGIHREYNFAKIYGCHSPCLWLETEFCPHSAINGGSVTSKRPHSNRICSAIIGFVNETKEAIFEGESFPYTKECIFKEIIFDSWIANHKKNKALQSGEYDDWKLALDWSKYVNDAKLKFLKQMEGSKVQITKNVVDDLRDIIDVTPKYDN
jgi:hypothetical protein